TTAWPRPRLRRMTQQPQTRPFIDPYWIMRGLYAANIPGLGEVISGLSQKYSNAHNRLGFYDGKAAIEQISDGSSSLTMEGGFYLPKKKLAARTEIFGFQAPSHY